MKSLRVLAAVILLFFGANVLLSFYSWFPSGVAARALVPIPETLGLLLVVALIAFRTPGADTSPPSAETKPPAGARKLLRLVGIGAVTGVLIGFSLAEALFQWIYARSFVPRMDIPAIRSLLLLYLGDIGPLVDLLTPPAIALLLLLFVGLGIGLVWVSVRLLTGAVDGDARSRRAAVVSLAALTFASLPFFFIAPPPRSLAAHTLVSWTESGRGEFRDIEVAPAAPEKSPEQTPEYRFPGILDRDIYLFTIEAYGYAAHSRPELYEQLEPSFRRLREVLENEGYTVLTSYLRSPVAGGFSWLAEATFFTGQWIDSQARFEQLYGAGLPTLPGMLQGGGYYTMSVRPGTVHGAWPEGWDIYRLEESLTAYDDAFDYVGPWFSYVPVTDQFAIWTAHQRIAELRSPGGAAAERPLFAHFQLVSSHTPFNKIPPYIEEWEDLGDGSIYVERSGEIRTYDNSWTGGTELEEGYVDAQSYVFRVITDYIDRHLDLDGSPIIMIFGDHQAQRPIRERDATLSVPIHVATRDPDIAAAFRRGGYQTGMISDQPPPHPEMSSFFPFFGGLATGGAVGGTAGAN